MKQNRYKALDQEFKNASLDTEEFLNMDEVAKQDYLDYLREKESRLREQAEAETKKPKLAVKLTKDADKIKNFLDEVDPVQEQETEVKKMEEQGKEKEEPDLPESTKKMSKREARMRERAKESFLDPGINKQVNLFIEKNGLEGHRIFYDRLSGSLVDNSAGAQAIASVKEKNGILTIQGYDVIDQIKKAEQMAIKDVEFAVGSADNLTKVYMVHKKNGNNTIYADFENEEGKETVPIREFQFNKTSYTKEAREKMFQDAKDHAAKMKNKILNAVDEMMQKADHTTVKDQVEEAESTESVYLNTESEKDLKSETNDKIDRPDIHNGKNITKALERTKKRYEINNKNMVFHVNGMNFDLKNIKGYTLIAMKDMELDGFDPKSLSVLYDKKKQYGFVIGSVQKEDKNICIELGKIDKDKNIEYLADEDIYKQLEEKNENQNIADHADEFDVNSKWEEPHEMDAIQVVCSKEGEFFATIYSDGKIHSEQNEKTPDAKSDVGKNIMESLDQIAIASGVEKDNLVVVDGCSYVTTVEGRQVGILSPEGTVLATEIDIKEQQLLFDFARENNIAMKDIDTDGHVIFHKDSQEILAEFSESIQENILSGETLDINIDSEKMEAIKSGELEYHQESVQKTQDTELQDPNDKEEEEVPFDEAFEQDDMEWGL